MSDSFQVLRNTSVFERTIRICSLSLSIAYCRRDSDSTHSTPHSTLRTRSWHPHRINSVFFDSPISHHNPQRDPAPNQYFNADGVKVRKPSSHVAAAANQSTQITAAVATCLIHLVLLLMLLVQFARPHGASLIPGRSMICFFALCGFPGRRFPPLGRHRVLRQAAQPVHPLAARR